MTRVVLNDFTKQWQAIGPRVLATVERVGASGRYILGDEAQRFEVALAAFCQLKSAVGVGSGLDALEIGLRCLNVTPGDRVLTTPLSAFATTLAIVRTGAVPVFVDVDATGLLDLERCRDVLSRERSIRVLVPVHLYGHALDLEDLAALRVEFDLRIVEDCAQSIGARSHGVSAGAIGQLAATSFYPTKNLGALGDGGAVLTADATLAEHARALRNYGQTRTYEHEYLGLNSRLDELHAAILHGVLLPSLTEWTARRKAVAARYRDDITSRWIHLPPTPSGSDSAWHLFPVLVEPELRPALVMHLRGAGVQTGVHYPTLTPGQRALASHAPFEIIGDLTNARRFTESEVSLPIHPFLSDGAAAHVIASCNPWSGQ